MYDTNDHTANITPYLMQILWPSCIYWLLSYALEHSKSTHESQSYMKPKAHHDKENEEIRTRIKAYQIKYVLDTTVNMDANWSATKKQFAS